MKEKRNFILKNLKRTPDGFEWCPNINLLHEKLSEISAKINLSRMIKKEDLLFYLGKTQITLMIKIEII